MISLVRKLGSDWCGLGAAILSLSLALSACGSDSATPSHGDAGAAGAEANVGQGGEADTGEGGGPAVTPADPV
jgi:hypothetical protein